jgi:hypothetical protein
MAYLRKPYYDHMRSKNVTEVEKVRAAWTPQQNAQTGVDVDSTLPFQNELSYNRNPLMATPYVGDPVEGYRLTRKFPGPRGSTVHVYGEPNNGAPIYQYGELERSTI